MPEYRFKCRDCKEKFSVNARMSEIGEGFEIECPECGSEDVFQTFDRVGILGCSSAVTSSGG